MRADVLLSGFVALCCASVSAQQDAPYLGDPIRYEVPTGNDPVAKLADRLGKGELELDRDERFGLLPALLSALGALPSSQALVFSKTSFQNALISPRNPRAIYFGDDVYVGTVPGSPIFELTSIDPVQGAIFYTLTDTKDGPPRIVRRDAECLRCHALQWTDNWPGSMVRSVKPDRDGTPIMRLGSSVTTSDTPFDERWGGWYVTGTHGDARHLGNLTLDDEPAPHIDREQGANLTDLSKRCAIQRHLTPHSDLVALMVLEHQTRGHNLIAQTGYRTRLALHRQQLADRATGKPTQGLSDSTRAVLKDCTDELIQFLLFRNESLLPAPVAGTSSFTADFAATGPRDREGRSLRTFDLQHRLFRYPCSYLIQGEAFRTLPVELRDMVLLRLLRILTGATGRRAYAHIGDEDRRVILRILVDTVVDLPQEWRDAVGH
ncbi:MAG: hypothetical protein U1F36_00470 [Planctomycetota bacterium]